jgi:hypothetical protein
MKRKKNRLTADLGKVLRRISDGTIAGKDIYLGMVYYMHGKKLDNPIAELPEHYEEIDEPVITEDSPFVADPEDILIEAEVPVEVNIAAGEAVQEAESMPPAPPAKVVITVQDFLELKKKVDMILERITEGV